MSDKQPNENGRWVERAWAARLVRFAVYAIPLALSIGTSIALTRIFDAPMSVSWAVARWVLIVGASTAVLIATERLSRRLLPLATLFTLSLAFPDKVPSRFKVAMRVGTTAQLRERIEAAQRGEVADSVDAAAEELIQLVGLLSHHDRLTRGHSERVRAYTHLVGVEMGISEESLERLRWAALLHDVGKITIPGAILNKPGRLTSDEFDTIKTHPMAGRQLVEPLAEWLGDSVRAVWEHHERVDGTGYPAGLHGTEISLAARIVSVTDAYDVMTSARSYKKPMTAAAARAELSRCAGTQFDPAVVRAFVAASIGTTQTATKPLALLAQLLIVPRTFVANATAALGVTAAVAAGTVAGSVGHSIAAERPTFQVDDTSIMQSDPTTTPESAGGAPGSDPVDTVSTSRTPAGPAGSFDPAVAEDSIGPAAPGMPHGRDDQDDNRADDDDSDVTTSTAPPAGPSTTLPSVTIPSTVTTSGPSGAPVTTLPTTAVPRPGVTLPPISLPPISLPPVTVPVISVPPVTVPVISVPPVTVPVISVPPIVVPSISVPVVPVTVPEIVVTVPVISVPPVTVPVISLPPVTVPVISLPPVTVPVITVPVISLPPLTGPGGLL